MNKILLLILLISTISVVFSKNRNRYRNRHRNRNRHKHRKNYNRQGSQRNQGNHENFPQYTDTCDYETETCKSLIDFNMYVFAIEWGSK